VEIASSSFKADRMTPALLSDRPHIARVRVRTPNRDALQVSLRAEALLGRLDLSPPGLPRSSILLICALHDPLPGCVSFARPAQTAPAQWQQAVTANLGRIAHEAARPVSGPVPTSAAAVLFADEAELVACLVHDWLRGRVADRWWWKSVLGHLSPPEWLRQHVLARGELMVPAIAVLASNGDAAVWFARLDDNETAEAIAAVARSHAMPQGVMERSIAQSPRGRREEFALERLRATVPEIGETALRPPQRRLLALALVLSRAPSWARTPQLALALQALDRAGAPAGAEAVALPDRTRLGTPDLPVPRIAATTVAQQAGEKPTHHAYAPKTADGALAPPAGSEERRVVAPGPPARPYAGSRGLLEGVPPAVTRAAVEESTASFPQAPVLRQEPYEPPAVEQASHVHTQFGGIFYLLNAALAMGLYSDFTAPRGANLRVSPWDWLALIGRAWFGREFVRDPVWELLAGLAVRGRRRLRRPRWLTAQLERLLARLALALGEERSADIPAFVCRYPADIIATASRVDVHLPLADLPLALRIGGLDRDPGWIPAAGRSIAFHFE
jgi:hypothetical protein